MDAIEQRGEHRLRKHHEHFGDAGIVESGGPKRLQVTVGDAARWLHGFPDEPGERLEFRLGDLAPSDGERVGLEVLAPCAG